MPPASVPARKPSTGPLWWLGLAVMLLLIFCVASWLLLYQPWPHGYEGDGVFVDRGWRGFGERYSLKLATWELSRDVGSKARFRVGGLPLPMRVGLRLLGAHRSRREDEMDRVAFRLRVWEPQRGVECVRFEGTARSGRERGFNDVGALQWDWDGDDIVFWTGRQCPSQSYGVWRTAPLEIEFEVLEANAAAWGRQQATLELVGGRPWN